MWFCSKRESPRCGLQMGEEPQELYIIRGGHVSVEASFGEQPTAQRAVDFPVNVASSSSGWWATLCSWDVPGSHPWLVACKPCSVRRNAVQGIYISVVVTMRILGRGETCSDWPCLGGKA